jgi:hypothetical protein
VPSRARRFLSRVGPVQRVPYRSSEIERLPNGTELSFVGHFLAIGQDEAVRGGDRHRHRTCATLVANAIYQRAVAGEPAGRALDSAAPCRPRGSMSNVTC